MTLTLSEIEQQLFKTIAEAAKEIEVEAFVVGGFVRDKILHRPTNDIDIVSSKEGIKLAKKVADQLVGHPQVHVFKNFGTAQIKTKDYEIEFVAARKESYSRYSRKPHVVHGTLTDDQNRRDFTINALAYSLNENDYGIIIDPFDGLLDLKDKIIRTPLEPEKTFSDDPLRMLRAIRFATQLGFFIENRSLEGIRNQKERLKIVSKERISGELNKIMMAEKPSVGFLLLKKSELLPQILPELEALCGVQYVDNKGHKDNFYHSIKVLDNIAPYTDNLWLRWAALLHDIGKAKAKRFDQQKGWTFHGHEIVSSRMIPKIFKRLKLPKGDKMAYVRKIISLHHRPVSLTNDNITDSALRRLLFDAGEDLEDLLTLCKADITSKNKRKRKQYRANFEKVSECLETVEEKDRIRNWQPPVGGHEIMTTFALKPSREVGLIKTAIREAILDGKIPNEYEAAHEFMLLKGKEFGLSPQKERQ